MQILHRLTLHSSIWPPKYMMQRCRFAEAKAATCTKHTKKEKSPDVGTCLPLFRLIGVRRSAITRLDPGARRCATAQHFHMLAKLHLTVLEIFHKFGIMPSQRNQVSREAAVKALDSSHMRLSFFLRTRLDGYCSRTRTFDCR